MQAKKYPLLEAREKTDKFEKFILSEFPLNTLIVIRANIPGDKKGSIESNWIVYKIFLECKAKFSAINIFHSYSEEEGLIFFLIVEDDALNCKRVAIKIEETHFFGRLADIDVLNSEKLFSRTDLPELINSDMQKRKCFLCGKSAVICARSKAHSKDEIMNFINSKVYADWYLNFSNSKKIVDSLAKLTEVAMLAELCRVYGFGCVTANGIGSHSDMDFLFMLDCIPIAGNAIRNLTDKECSSFYALRDYGKKIEEQLFKQTNGVNTYKGAFFLLLILNSCIYRRISNRKNFLLDTSLLINEIATFSKDVQKDFYNKNCSNVSLNTFLKTGNGGVRDDVLSGFKKHFNEYLPMLKNGENINKIILTIMSETCDTTIINRRGLEKLIELQKKSREIIFESSNCNTEKLYEDCRKLSLWCEAENISTGGTADKLIILYFLFILEKKSF